MKVQEYPISDKTGYQTYTGSQPEVVENPMKAYHQTQDQRCM